MATFFVWNSNSFFFDVTVSFDVWKTQIPDVRLVRIIVLYVDKKNIPLKQLCNITILIYDNFNQWYMSHFAYACKMRYPLNLVLEKSEYLYFY